MAPTWINSAVVMEALVRYEQGRLPQQMRHWLRTLLELPDDVDLSSSVLPHHHQP